MGVLLLELVRLERRSLRGTPGWTGGRLSRIEDLELVSFADPELEELCSIGAVLQGLGGFASISWLRPMLISRQTHSSVSLLQKPQSSSCRRFEPMVVAAAKSGAGSLSGLKPLIVASVSAEMSSIP